MTKPDRVLRHLQTIGPLDRDEAQRLYGDKRLAATIDRLRRSGHNIKASRRKDGCAVYRLAEQEEPDMPLFGGTVSQA